VARTDAAAPLGLDEAIRRGKLYREIGADIVFVEAPRSIEDMKKIANQIHAPLVANMIEEGVTPNLPAAELKELGFCIALFPLSGVYSSTFGIYNTFKTLEQSGTTKSVVNTMMQFKEFNELVQLDKYMNMEKKYA